MVNERTSRQTGDATIDVVLDRLSRSIGFVCTWIAFVAIVLLALHSVLHGVMRTFFEAPITGTIEYVGGWYLPILVFLGLALAQSRKEHIEAPIFFDKAPQAVRAEWQLLSYLTSLVTCGLFGWYGLTKALDNMDIGMTAGISGITVWPATFSVPIGFFALALAILVDLVILVRSWRTPIADVGNTALEAARREVEEAEAVTAARGGHA